MISFMYYMMIFSQKVNIKISLHLMLEDPTHFILIRESQIRESQQQPHAVFYLFILNIP